MSVPPKCPVHVPLGVSGSTNICSTKTDAELHREKFRRRLPDSLDELRGPVSGVVEPPLTVVWSGLRAFDLASERQRMSLYRTVLAEGMRKDLCALLSKDVLVWLWPTLRMLVSTAVRDVWEDRFPDLRDRSDVPPARPPARRRSQQGPAAA